jgi:hypothetical protein
MSVHFRNLVIVPILVAMGAFPASAQTSSSTGTVGAQSQSELTDGTASSNPATEKAGSSTATPNAKTDSMAAAKSESVPAESHPQSDPGTKKAGSTVLISINKTNQEMTVSLWME